MPYPALRCGRLDRLHVLLEAYAEVRVVPGHDGALDLAEEEGEVFGHLAEAEGLVVDRRVDAEAAGVGAAQAGDHRDDLDGRRFGQRRFYELPAGREARQFGRLPG